MFDQLHNAAKVGAKVTWIGQAEGAAADLSLDYFIIYGLSFVAASIFVCWCLIIQLQLYQMCPGWGPIRKFDSDGTEDMRINQLLMHEVSKGVGHNSKGDKRNIDENVAFLQGMIGQAHGELTNITNKAQGGQSQNAPQRASRPGVGDVEAGAIDDNGLYTGFQQTYGTIGQCTWGYCESPNQWGEPRYDPNLGREVVVRHGFADTQWMRAHSRTWAKDETYWMQANGLRPNPPSLQDETAVRITQRMVIERGGY